MHINYYEVELPLTVGKFNIDNFDKVTSTQNITGNKHNIYDNIVFQILVAKLNIGNGVKSCSSVDQSIRYDHKILSTVNYHGVGTSTQKFLYCVMQNMIKIHSLQLVQHQWMFYS
jgi:hypothetical protein